VLSPSVRRRLRVIRDAVLRTVTELLTTVYAACVLAVVEATIRWVPLPRLSTMLGCPLELSPSTRGPAITSSHDLGRRARRELRCTQRVADTWPLSHGPCLRRALVGGHLLRRLGTCVRLGTYDDGGSLVAHAWLEVDGRPLEDVSNYRHFESIATTTPEEPPA
jgi:hypothetical protein